MNTKKTNTVAMPSKVAIDGNKKAIPGFVSKEVREMMEAANIKFVHSNGFIKDPSEATKIARLCFFRFSADGMRSELNNRIHNLRVANENRDKAYEKFLIAEEHEKAANKLASQYAENADLASKRDMDCEAVKLAEARANKAIADVADAKADLDAAEAKLNAVKQGWTSNRKEADAQVRGCDKYVKEFGAKLKIAQGNLGRLERQLDDAKSLAESDSMEDRLAKLKNRRKSVKTKLTRAIKAADKAALELETFGATGDYELVFNAADKAEYDIRCELSRIESEIAAVSDILGDEERLTKWNRARDNAASQIDIIARDIEMQKQEIAGIEDTIKRLNAKRDECNAILHGDPEEIRKAEVAVEVAKGLVKHCERERSSAFSALRTAKERSISDGTKTAEKMSDDAKRKAKELSTLRSNLYKKFCDARDDAVMIGASVELGDNLEFSGQEIRRRNAKRIRNSFKLFYVNTTIITNVGPITVSGKIYAESRNKAYSLSKMMKRNKLNVAKIFVCSADSMDNALSDACGIAKRTAWNAVKREGSKAQYDIYIDAVLGRQNGDFEDMVSESVVAIVAACVADNDAAEVAYDTIMRMLDAISEDDLMESDKERIVERYRDYIETLSCKGDIPESLGIASEIDEVEREIKFAHSFLAGYKARCEEYREEDNEALALETERRAERLAESVPCLEKRLSLLRKLDAICFGNPAVSQQYDFYKHLALILKLFAPTKEYGDTYEKSLKRSARIVKSLMEITRLSDREKSEAIPSFCFAALNEYLNRMRHVNHTSKYAKPAELDAMIEDGVNGESRIDSISELLDGAFREQYAERRTTFNEIYSYVYKAIIREVVRMSFPYMTGRQIKILDAMSKTNGNKAKSVRIVFGKKAQTRMYDKVAENKSATLAERDAKLVSHLRGMQVDNEVEISYGISAMEKLMAKADANQEYDFWDYLNEVNSEDCGIEYPSDVYGDFTIEGYISDRPDDYERTDKDLNDEAIAWNYIHTIDSEMDNIAKIFAGSILEAVNKVSDMYSDDERAVKVIEYCGRRLFAMADSAINTGRAKLDDRCNLLMRAIEERDFIKLNDSTTAKEMLGDADYEGLCKVIKDYLANLNDDKAKDLVAGKTYREIAIEHGCTKDVVYNRAKRIVKDLRSICITKWPFAADIFEQMSLVRFAELVNIRK